jgi:hypothetical protein
MTRSFLSLLSVLMFLGAAGCEFEERLPAEIVSLSKSQPLGGEKSLEAEVRFDIGSLEVAGDKSASVYSFDLDYDKSSYNPDVRYEEAGEVGRLHFRLESMRKLGLRADRRPNRLRLNLSPNLPLRLSVNTGVGDARLSLTGLKISDLQIESGVGGSRLSAYEANSVSCDRIRIKNGVGSLDATGLGNLNFRELEFEGGVGGASLDFSGEWQQNAEIRIQVGVGGVSVRVPRSVGVKVEGHKNFLSGFHLDGFTKRDSLYFSENYDAARIRVAMQVVTGVGGFRISWI